MHCTDDTHNLLCCLLFKISCFAEDHWHAVQTLGTVICFLTSTQWTLCRISLACCVLPNKYWALLFAFSHAPSARINKYVIYIAFLCVLALEPLNVICRLVTQSCLESKEIYHTRRSVSLGTRRSIHTKLTRRHAMMVQCVACTSSGLFCTPRGWSPSRFRHPLQTNISSPYFQFFPSSC